MSLDPIRDLAFLEMYSGEAGISAQVGSLGYRVATFDRGVSDEFQDACTRPYLLPILSFEHHHGGLVPPRAPMFDVVERVSGSYET
eukprot:7139983-Pyramimonas_sp.AAC.1